MAISKSISLNPSMFSDRVVPKAHSKSEFHLELDGLRGLAASMVVFYHGSEIISHHWLDSIYARIVAFGHSGVDLFFVLSGYLITSILFRDFSTGQPLYFFYIRRALRILPLLFALILVLGLGPIILSAWPVPKIKTEELLASLLFLSNFKMATAGYYFLNFLGCTWSVSLEEQFYLLWPLLTRNLSKERLLKIGLIIILTSALFRIFLVSRQISPVFINVMFFCRVDTLIFGSVLYLVKDKLAKDGRAVPIAYLILALGIALLFLIEFFERATYPYLGSSIGLSLMGLTYSALIFLLLCAPQKCWLRSFFRIPFLTLCGKFCYGIYLLHGPVMYFLEFYGFRSFVEKVSLLLASAGCADLFRNLTYLTLTLFFAGIVFYSFEMPFLKLQKRYR